MACTISRSGNPADRSCWIYTLGPPWEVWWRRKMIQGWSRAWPWAHCITCPNHEYKSSGLLVVPVNLVICCDCTLFKLWAAPSAGISVRGLGAVTRFSLAVTVQIDSFTRSILACKIAPRVARFPSAGLRRARCRVRLLISLSACPAVSGLAKREQRLLPCGGRRPILFYCFLFVSTKGVGEYPFSFCSSKVRSRQISFLFQTFRKHSVLSSSH